MNRPAPGRLIPVIAGLALAASCAPAGAGEPPNQADPCSRNGKNICGTNGVGKYVNYKFGPRWFGDYRKAVPGENDPTFCIDLRYWYPGKAYKYEKRPTSGLKNRDGKAISAATLRKMNLALWRYGRSNDSAQQGAVMLYVHRLMGDGAPGEVDPKAGGTAVRNAYDRIVKFAERYGDPLTVTLQTSKDLQVGEAAKLTVRVRTSTGVPLPGVSVALSGKGQDGLPKSIVSDNDGVVSVSYTPADAAGLRVTAKAAGVPAAAPTMYAPTSTSGRLGGASRSGQRLVAAATTERTATLAADVAPAQAQPVITTQASSNSVTPGTAVTDSAAVSGLQGQPTTVKAELFGPYPASDAMTCEGTPFWSGSFDAAGDGTYATDPVTLTTPGFYTYRMSITETATMKGLVTPCGEPTETIVVTATPTVRTQVSEAETSPGAELFDNVIVDGLGTLRATVDVKLYGPFPTKDAIRCDGTPAWIGTVTANGDGTYPTEKFKVEQVGYYTYVEALAATSSFTGAQGACGAESETSIVRAAPTVTTTASDAVVAPGSNLSDTLKVTGVAGQAITIRVDLFGPFRSRAQIRCTGRPLSTVTVKVTEDGTYRSPSTRLKRAGFYTYRERVVGSTLVKGSSAACGEEAETALAKPLIQTGRTAPPVPVMSAATEAPKPAVDARQAVGPAPRSISIKTLGISGPVDSVTINSRGELGVPVAIRRGGWWRDGAAPTSNRGTTLIGGHIDSAKDGAGIFYNLSKATRGQRVRVTLTTGKTVTYRVTSVTRVSKSALPEWIFSRSGPRRLALVTCGGPFDSATGHYRDNVIVTAVPV